MTLKTWYRPYAYDVTIARIWGSMLGVKRDTATCSIAKHAASGQPLHLPPSWAGPAHWLRGWASMRSASTTRARNLTPSNALVVMETWRQCIWSIHMTHFAGNLSFCQAHTFKELSPTLTYCQFIICMFYFSKFHTKPYIFKYHILQF